MDLGVRDDLHVVTRDVVVPGVDGLDPAARPGHFAWPGDYLEVREVAEALAANDERGVIGGSTDHEPRLAHVLIVVVVDARLPAVLHVAPGQLVHRLGARHGRAAVPLARAHLVPHFGDPPVRARLPRVCVIPSAGRCAAE